jgi:cellulose synthase (UDP-forming)
MRFADVSYLAFLGHILPALIVLIGLAYMIRADGLFRPQHAKVLGWEKAFFAALQWPWVLWGCIMAVRDKLTGRFVDFRITPKGEAASSVVPWPVLLPYFGLALVSLMPVLLVDNVVDAPGFYLFALLNAAIYTGLFLIIVVNHIRENPTLHRTVPGYSVLQFVCVAILGAGIATGLVERSREATIALATTSGEVSLIRSGYRVAGAGQGAVGDVYMTYNDKWFAQLIDHWLKGEGR